MLDDLLSASGCALDAVVALVVAHDEAVARLLGRNQGRADDTAELIRRRLAVYEEQAAALVRVYGARGLVTEVDGRAELPEVTGRVLASIGAVSALDPAPSTASSPVAGELRLAPSGESSNTL